MKMLITGGAGFIGSHLCDKYAGEGHAIVCLDNFLSGDLRNVRHLLDYHNFQLLNGDIRDDSLLDRIMPGMDVIFHLAAQIHVDRSYIEPELTYGINVIGTQKVLESAKRHNVKRIVFASTSEVYGSAQYIPIDEKHPLDAPHLYGASKIAADRMCAAYIQAYEMDITIMRMFNVFGPRQRDVGYGGVISLFVRRVLSNLSPIIYGDGKQSRDYIYIEDAVRAYDLVLSHKEPINEPINFGSGRETAINDLANAIIDFFGKGREIKPVHAEPRIGEVQRLLADINKARSILGWEPRVNLTQGLKEIAQWYASNGFEQRLGLG
jgi:UDP-glucose 4-epimerase